MKNLIIFTLLFVSSAIMAQSTFTWEVFSDSKYYLDEQNVHLKT